MTDHSRFCLCHECVDTDHKQYNPATVTRIHERAFDPCAVCGAPHGSNLQSICVALLDMQVSATAEQKADHVDAIELAKNVIRERINGSLSSSVR